MSIDSVRKIYFNSTASTIGEVKAFLLSLEEEGAAHPFHLDGKLWLYYVKDGSVERVDITDIPAERWTSNARVGDLAGTIFGRLQGYITSGVVSNMAGYSLVTLSPGDRVEIQIVPGKEGALIVSDKRGNMYFDMTQFFGKRDRENPREVYLDGMVHYNRTTLGDRGEFIHSGDMGSLLHTVKYGTLQVGRMTSIAAVGFRKKPLRGFADQQPCVCLIQHPIPERGITGAIYIVPCPLDEISVGSSTCVHLVAGVAKEGPGGSRVMVYHVPTRPRRSPDRDMTNFDTDSWNGPVRELAKEAIKDCVQAEASYRPPVEAAAAAPPMEKEVVMGDAPVVPGPVALIQSDAAPFIGNLPGLPKIYWQNGYTTSPSGDKRILPVPNHRMKGPVCALGAQPEIVPSDTHKTIVVVYGSTDPNDPHLMRDIDAKTPEQKRNAVYVVAGPEVIPSSHGEVVTFLDKLVMSAVNNMAGPNSVILYQDKTGATVWYRGTILPGLFDRNYKYGEKVSLEGMTAWLEDGVVYKWPVFTDNDDTRIWVPSPDGDYTPKSTDEILGWLTGLSLDEISDPTMQEQIRSILNQLSATLDQAQVDNFTSKVYPHLEEMIERATQAEKDAFMAAYTSKDTEAIRRTIDHLRMVKKQISMTIKPIVDEIGNLLSSRGVSQSGKNKTLYANVRAAKVDGNVKATNSMSLNAVWEYICENADDCHILALPDHGLRTLLQLVSQGKLNESLSTGGTAPPAIEVPVAFETLPRLSMLDTDACAIIAEVDPRVAPLNQINPGQEPSSLALPESCDNPGAAVLPLPILTEYASDEWDPRFAGKYQDVANEKLFSTLRIKIRGTLAGGSYRLVQPQDYELGFMLIYLIFAAMRSLARMMTRPSITPAGVTGDDVSTNMRAMRSHFAQLLAVMGSGKDPSGLHYAHCLFHIGTYVNMPKKPNQWWVYPLMAEYLPYTGWKQEIQDTFRDNMRTLVLNVIWKYVVEKVITKMNLISKKEKVQTVKEDVWYYYLRLLVETTMACADPTNEARLTPELAKELLHRCPERVTKGTKMMNDTLLIRANLEMLAALPLEEAAALKSRITKRLMMVAVYSFVKHGLDVPEKKPIRVEIGLNLDHPGKLLKIYKKLCEEHPGKMWSISSLDHAKEMETLLGTASASAAPPGDVEVVAAAAPVEMTLRDRLGLIPGSRAAVELLDTLDAGSSDPIAGVPIYDLIHACGVPRDRAPAVYRSMVRAYIAEPKDTEAGRDAARTWLASS